MEKSREILKKLREKIKLVFLRVNLYVKLTVNKKGGKAMMGVEFSLEEGKRLELVEDFTLLRDYTENQKSLPKYSIIYDPLFRISPQGVKTFSGYYQVIKVNGNGEEQIGIVSKGYRPISTVAEVMYLLEKLKELKKEEDITVDVSISDNIPRIFFGFKKDVIEFPIIPYETLAGRSFLHPVYDTLDFEKLRKGIEIINSYTGEIANSLLGFWYRFICGNGLTERGVGLSFRHRFVVNKVLKFLEKIAKDISKVEETFLYREKSLMTPISDDEIEIFEVKRDLERYRIREEIISDYFKELNLIREVRGGKIPKWDFVNVLTALTTHRLKKFVLIRKFQKKAYELLSTFSRN